MLDPVKLRLRRVVRSWQLQIQRLIQHDDRLLGVSTQILDLVFVLRDLRVKLAKALDIRLLGLLELLHASAHLELELLDRLQLHKLIL